MEIAQARVEDAEQILALQKRAFQSEAELYGDWMIPPLTQTLNELREDFSRATFLKAQLDSMIVGSVRASEHGGAVSIGRLIVHPAYQRRGIGRRLMIEIESRLAKARYYELFTGSLSEENIRFYKRLGYAASHARVVSANLTLVYLQKACRFESA